MKKFLKKRVQPLPPESTSPAEPPHPPKIYFCHVPKCAGSSLNSALKQQLSNPNETAHFDIKLRESNRAAKILDTSMMSVRETILAYNLSIKSNFYGRGHSYCRPDLVSKFSDEWDFLTILRDPIERWISLYTYNTFKESEWAKNTLPLNDYMKSQKGISAGQSFIHYFSDFSISPNSNPSDYIDQAIQNLQQFSIVGITHHIDLLAQQINKDYKIELEIPKNNVSPNHTLAQQIQEESKTIKQIEQICTHDIEIYKRFTGEFGPIFSRKAQNTA
ncbi:sulfotransferase family 2 domain-containing protein [Microbulbifer echini]|uniref:Sulfotransferase family 2 domain-containing protein n=1 Tax=Microbulbifer echini TaxID=1529067 RepID=A0ABV4NRA8_9GAMM